MNKKRILLNVLFYSTLVIGTIIIAGLFCRTVKEETAYREQSRQEIRQLQEQVHETKLYLQETKKYWEQVQQFLDRLNVMSEQTVTYYAPYDSRGLCHDGTPDTTATGTKPKPGTFAVDPKQIPLGSHMAVIYADGTVEVGKALDTGGSIKGNRIDCFRWTHDEAVRDGKKEATVVWICGKRSM